MRKKREKAQKPLAPRPAIQTAKKKKKKDNPKTDII
jgi:hypothetical protein